MASLIQRGRRYSIRFRHEGCQHRVTVDTSRPKADRVRAEIERVLDDLRLGRVVVPEGVDSVRFIAGGGRSPHQAGGDHLLRGRRPLESGTSRGRNDP